MAGEASKKIDASVLWGGGRSPFSVSFGKMMMWFFLVSDALTFGGLLIALGYARTAWGGDWPLSENVFFHFPLAGHAFLPLMYVALMTFILIVSSVTMVMAVEAGHRNDKKGVIKWLAATVIGGFVFLGSQAWEWSTFIAGPDGHFGTQEVVVTKGEYEEWKHAEEAMLAGEDSEEGEEHAEEGEEHGHGDYPNYFLLNYGVWEWNEAGDTAIVSYNDDATLKQNYYGFNENFDHHHAHETAVAGPLHYGQFFFFITGFHGFHVFSGVIINLLVLIGVMRGVYERRGHYEMVEKVGLYWHFVDLVWVFVFTFYYLL